MESLEQDPEVREELLQLREERPELEDLRPFLPPHADLERAWDLLTAIDMHSIGREEQEPSLAAEDYMDRFAVYLGIRDSTWDPEADSEALAEGDYEDEEGLPDEWQGFVVMAVPQLRVL